MQRRIEEICRIILTKGTKYSKRIIDLKGTIPILDVSHVMRKATLQRIALETKDPPEQTRRGIMLTLLKKMNQKEREQGKIPQAMRNMYFDLEGFNQ